MSDQAVNPNAEAEEVEILGEMVRPIKRTSQVTKVDAVAFLDAQGTCGILHKVGDDMTLPDGSVVKILSMRANYTEKVVAFLYETTPYKDPETGFTFDQEKAYTISGLPFSAMCRDEVVVKDDKQAMMQAAKMKKQTRLHELAQAQAAERKSADEQANEPDPAQDKAPTSEGVEPEAQEEVKPSEPEGKEPEGEAEENA